ncbi:MAG: hypothetical protein JOZ54_04470 [Acidobacteria bacterium]|nr:hypothetical protein [Acidobacteriota bacterium]
MRRLPLALPFLLLTFTLAAQDLSGYEKILLPVDPFVTVLGASGTQFSTRLDVWGPAPFQYYFGGDATHTYDPTSPAPEPLQPLSGPPTDIGRLLSIEKNAVPNVSLHLELTAQPAGAADYLGRIDSVPVVRERDFRTGAIVFPRIPFPYVYLTDAIARQPSDLYRHLLRIYDVDARGDAAVRIKVYHLNIGGTLIKEAVVPINGRYGNDPSFPNYAVVDLDTLFSHCIPFSQHTPCLGMNARIEITPETPGLRYWAFVSVTNNFTQEVTLYNP